MLSRPFRAQLFLLFYPFQALRVYAALATRTRLNSSFDSSTHYRRYYSVRSPYFCISYYNSQMQPIVCNSILLSVAYSQSCGYTTIQCNSFRTYTNAYYGYSYTNLTLHTTTSPSMLKNRGRQFVVTHIITTRLLLTVHHISLYDLNTNYC